MTATLDVVLLDSPPRWRVGGGCEAPLTVSGAKVELTSPRWTCPLTSSDGLPFLRGYSWKSGDVLRVDRAAFTRSPFDQMTLDFAFQVQTDPQYPTIGSQVEFTQPDGFATRVK